MSNKEWAQVESVIRHSKMEYDEAVVLGGVYGRLSSEIEQLKADKAALLECINKALRVTADGSIPDEWDYSTGGAGHAEIRRILNACLQQIGGETP